MKKIICIILIILMAFCLCSCAVAESTNQNDNTLPSDSGFYFWTDEETGVQYIVYDGYRRGGICPRLNPDGSLHTSHPTEEGGEAE